jgi:hypothetical protein
MPDAYDPTRLAALIRIAITPATMSGLYRIGVVRPAHESEDLATALARLTLLAETHGLRVA